MKQKRFFVLFAMILSLLLAFQISAMAENADLPDDLKEIGEAAFYGDQSITSLTIPDGAETIGARAFAYSGLEQIYIPASVMTIPADAFDGVQDLTIISPFDAPARAYAFDHQGISWQGDVPITEFTFPDSNFRSVVSGYDSNEDGILSIAEIQVVTEIACDAQGIADLRGIEFFSELTSLVCQGNQLTSLDVSHNPALTTLSCYGNALTELDVSQNPALETLACSNNPLTSIDVSNNQNLQELSCNNNSQLESVNVSNNSSLISLYCNSCPSLTNLNVQSCTSLELLSANGSGLTGLDVSNNRNLKILFCWRNNLTSLNLNQNNALVRVNLSANQNMNQLTLGQAPNLEMLWVQNTALTQIDISGAPIIVDAYQNGEQAEFYGNGQVALPGESGNYGFYGYMIGNGINSYSQMEVDHYNFNVSKNLVINNAIKTA